MAAGAEGKRAWLAAAALLLTLPFALLHEALQPGNVLASSGLEWKLPWRTTSTPEELALPQTTGDAVRENLVYRTFLHESLAQGRVPWWWPFAAGGLPFVGLGHTQVLYPPSWMAAPFDPLASLGWLVAFHLVVAGLGTLLWMRNAGLAAPAACLGALVFMLNAMFASRHGHPQFVASGCWLPWALAGVEEIARGRSARGALLVATAAALAVLAGHPSIYVFGFYFVGGWLVLRLAVFPDRPPGARRRIAAASVFVGALAIGVGLASIQLLATLELGQFSGRAQREPTDLASQLTHWSHFLRVLFPDILGTPTRASYWSVSPTSFKAGAISIGTLPFVLAIVGALCGGRRGAALGLLILGVLAVLYLPGAFDLAYHLPGFQFSRVDRLSIAWFLGTAFLAGLGLQWALAEGTSPSGRRKLRWAALGSALAGVGLAALALETLPDLAASAAYPPRGGLDVAALRTGIVWGLALLGFACAWLAWASRARTRWWLGVAAIGFAAADLGTQASAQVVVRRAERIFRATPATRFLQSVDGPFRIAKFGGREPSPLAEVPADEETVFPANTPSVYGIEDLHVFGPLHPEDLDVLLAAVEPRLAHPWRVAPFEREASLASPVLDLLGVRYVLTARPVAVAGLRLVHEGDVFIYENENALPRALFVPGWELASSWEAAARLLASGAVDPRDRVLLQQAPSEVVGEGAPDPGVAPAANDVRLLERDTARVALEKTGPDAGFVLLTGRFYPGWRASVDGDPAPVLRADVMFQAVRVGPGTRRIVFEYRPTALRLGAWATLAALAGLAAVAWRAARPGLTQRASST